LLDEIIYLLYLSIYLLSHTANAPCGFVRYPPSENGENKEDVIQRIKEDKVMLNNKKQLLSRITLVWK
jgi:hypothetical protein